MRDVDRARDALLSLVGRIYVINLPHRADRRDEMAAQLARLGLGFDHPAVTLFEARRFDDAAGFRTPGVRGCFDSHRRVLHTIADGDAAAALVLEDDTDFSRNAVARLPGLCSAIAERDFGLFYGWHPDDHEARDRPDDTRLVALAPDRPVMLSHCHVVTRDTAAKAALFLDALLTRPPGSPEGGAMDLDGALSWFRRAHPEVTTLCPVGALALQRPSRSDVAARRWYDKVGWLAGWVAALRRAKRSLAARRG